MDGRSYYFNVGMVVQNSLLFWKQIIFEYLPEPLTHLYGFYGGAWRRYPTKGECLRTTRSASDTSRLVRMGIF